MLTDRQKRVLDFIQREQREKGLTPSTREIQNHFRFASQTSIMQYIAALERKGFLDRHARKARALITPAMKVRITDVPIYGQIPAGMSALPSRPSKATCRSMRAPPMCKKIAARLPCGSAAIR